LRNFNENTITDAVLGRITGATDTRIPEISEALVRHLVSRTVEVREDGGDPFLRLHVIARIEVERLQ
jgi:hypothetical protein